MAYPSVISQPGSAQRNLAPVLAALRPLVEDQATPVHRVLELASYPYEHIRAYGSEWPDVVFQGTARDGEEIGNIVTDDLAPNVAKPVQLDITVEQDWEKLHSNTAVPYDGVVMLNLIHCTPEGAPEAIFKHLSPLTPEGRALLGPQGWIAAYGAYLNDDGTYRSEGDEKFDTEYIKKKWHPSLGLRTPVSISAYADKWGFDEERRVDMPAGNLWIVWRAREKQ